MGKFTIDIKFQVLKNNDPSNIVVLDMSQWGQVEDKPAIIEITLPGFSTPVVHYFNKRSVNYFNSINLGLSCEGCGDEEVELPDGVYTITVKASPDKFQNTLSYLKTDKARRKLDEIYMKIDFCNNEINSELISRIKKIDLYIKAAEANIRYDNVCEAQELFFKAQEDIKKLQNCKTCV